MYLHAVEASWLDNPFWRSRFLITRESEIAALRQSAAAMVVIDLERGIGPDVDAEPAQPEPARAAPVAAIPPASTFAAERDRAAAMIARTKEAMKNVFEDSRHGAVIQSEKVRAIADEIAGSVRAHPHALIGMVRLKSKHEYTYVHSVAVCALMVNLARQLGLDEALVRDMGLAGLLHDIGKMAVPDAILNKPGALDDVEFGVIRTHPRRGGDMLRRAKDMPAIALDVCHHHHEKVDGTGYPFGLRGDEISLAARMGAVCDVYDALTSDRPYKAGWSPSEAVSQMHGWTGQFDPAILFAFFQSIAVFPAGMLVRMRTQYLAIVLPNGRRASRPRLRLFYDIAQDALIRPRDLVLASPEASRDIAIEEAPADWPVRDWPGLRAHLTREADVLDLAAIGRLWRDPTPSEAAPTPSKEPKVSVWRPGQTLN